MQRIAYVRGRAVASLIRSAAVGNHGRRLVRWLALAACVLAPGAGLVAQITREAPAAPPLPSAALDLRPLFSQQRPILDVLAEQNRRHVLDATGVTVYERAPTGWQAAQSYPVTPQSPWPRDLHGMLAVNVDAVEVFLPGLWCSLSTPDRRFACQASARSFWLDVGLKGPFELRGNRFVAADGFEFYSLLALSAPTAGASYVAGASDGYLTLLDADRRPLARMMPGDDAAALVGGCRDESYVLARMDADGGDALGVFQVRDRAMKEVSPRRLLQGRLTALWPDSSDTRTGRVVVRAADAERYDAYQVTVACVR
jgi:hypothetical protein